MTLLFLWLLLIARLSLSPSTLEDLPGPPKPIRAGEHLPGLPSSATSDDDLPGPPKP